MPEEGVEEEDGVEEEEEGVEEEEEDWILPLEHHCRDCGHVHVSGCRCIKRRSRLHFGFEPEHAPVWSFKAAPRKMT